MRTKTLPSVQTHKLAQKVKALSRALLPEIIGLVLAAFIWTYNDYDRKSVMKSFTWFCRGCKAQITLKPTKEAAEYLEAGNRISLDCDCGRRYLISKGKVIDYDEWLLVRYFRVLLNHDIIAEIEWEEDHHNER